MDQEKLERLRSLLRGAETFVEGCRREKASQMVPWHCDRIDDQLEAALKVVEVELRLLEQPPSLRPGSSL